MNPKFERYRRELSGPRLNAFEAFCFHRAQEVAQPWSALKRAPLLWKKETVEPIVHRVFDAVNDNSDKERLCEALRDKLEGPGSMPGLIELRGETGNWFAYGRNIYQERGEPFTLENLLAPVFYGLSSDPEHYFENVRGGETDVLFNCFHVTDLGLEFCEWLFPERMKEVRQREEAASR